MKAQTQRLAVVAFAAAYMTGVFFPPVVSAAETHSHAVVDHHAPVEHSHEHHDSPAFNHPHDDVSDALNAADEAAPARQVRYFAALYVPSTATGTSVYVIKSAPQVICKEAPPGRCPFLHSCGLRAPPRR